MAEKLVEFIKQDRNGNFHLGRETLMTAAMKIASKIRIVDEGEGSSNLFQPYDGWLTRTLQREGITRDVK